MSEIDICKNQNYMYGYKDGYVDGVKECDPYIRRWISIKEKLPDQDGRYLVYIPWGDNGWVGISSFRSDGHRLPSFDDLASHWMPLPESPK